MQPEGARAFESKELAVITNERQYQITKRKTERFVRALDEFDANEQKGADVSIRLLQAERNALKAQLTALRDEVEEYEQVKDEGVAGLEITPFNELPKLLIKARIATGMTHRELAERIHVKEQQIQRYEASGYASASFQRLCDVAHALGVDSRTRFLVQFQNDKSESETEKGAKQDSASAK